MIKSNTYTICLHLLAIEGGVIYDLPSGLGKMAFAPHDITLTFDEAKQFCEANYFDGLVEVRTLEDSHFIAWLFYCACSDCTGIWAGPPSGTYAYTRI